MEKLEELKQIIAVSKQVGVEPMIGIRARLLSKPRDSQHPIKNVPRGTFLPTGYLGHLGHSAPRDFRPRFQRKNAVGDDDPIRQNITKRTRTVPPGDVGITGKGGER